MTKSTEQQTTFVNTIAEKDAEINQLKEQLGLERTFYTALQDINAKLNQALDIAEYGLVISNGLWATDLPMFEAVVVQKNINGQIIEEEHEALRMFANKNTYWRIDNAADLRKIRELRNG